MSKKSSPKSKRPASGLQDIQVLAHAGTLEAIERLKDMREIVKGDKRAMVELALDEAMYFYTSPTDDAEEQDWRLCAMMNERKERQYHLLVTRETVQDRLQNLEIEKKVANAVFKHASKDTKEHARLSSDVVRDLHTMEEQRLQELEQEIQDVDAWLKAADGLLVTEKYRKMPEDLFSFIRMDEEDACDFDEDDDVHCPHCGTEDVEWVDER